MIFLPWVEWFFNMFKCDFELDDFLLWVRQFSVTCWVRWFSKWVVHAFLDIPWKNEQHQWIPWGWICIKSTKTWKWQNLDLYLFSFFFKLPVPLCFHSEDILWWNLCNLYLLACQVIQVTQVSIVVSLVKPVTVEHSQIPFVCWDSLAPMATSADLAKKTQ